VVVAQATIISTPIVASAGFVKRALAKISAAAQTTQMKTPMSGT